MADYFTAIIKSIERASDFCVERKENADEEKDSFCSFDAMYMPVLM